MAELRPDPEQIANRLKNTYKRPELNALARDHYGIADPVGYRTQDELIAAMIAANADRAAVDAGFDVPDTAALNEALTDALNARFDPTETDADASIQGEPLTDNDFAVIAALKELDRETLIDALEAAGAEDVDQPDRDNERLAVFVFELIHNVDTIEGHTPVEDVPAIADVLASVETPNDTGTDDEPEPEVSEGRVLILGNGPHNRTAFWERHADHPGGEVFVRGGQRAEASLTTAVQRAARQQRIAIIDGK